MSIKSFWLRLKADWNALAAEVAASKRGEKRMARIEITPEGKAALFDGSTPVATYARKRDAVRGAARRGLQLA